MSVKMAEAQTQKEASDPVTAHLDVDRAELATGMQVISRLITFHDKSKAILSYDGSRLQIALSGMGATMRATGSWKGEARVSRKVIRALAQEMPAGDPVQFTVTGNELQIGSTTVRCVWQPLAKTGHEEVRQPPGSR